MSNKNAEATEQWIATLTSLERHIRKTVDAARAARRADMPALTGIYTGVKALKESVSTLPRLPEIEVVAQPRNRINEYLEHSA
jgi:hypothetical protein